MTRRGLGRGLALAMAAGGLLAACALAGADDRPFERDLELEALEEAVRWPNADVQTIVTLADRFLADRRDREAYAYFEERARSEPARVLFLALEGLFQARVADQVSLFRRVAWVNEAVAKLDRAAAAEPGLTRYFRGLVLAELPERFGRAEAAVTDLEWVLQNRGRFPHGLRRSVYRALARAYTTLGREADAEAALERSGYPSLDPGLPLFTTDSSVTAGEGFRFTAPTLVEMAPRVYVAQGYDFADIAFVVTADGVVAIDAGTTEANASAALAALRRITPKPITHVILTHAHWDHVGGLGALEGPDTVVIAQAGFAEELRIVNETGVPFRYFFGPEGRRRYDVAPDRLVGTRERLTIGGTELDLYPVRGGETEDALLVHVPASGALFVGDAFMPYLGAPFLPEGSAEGLFETVAAIRALNPRLLIHGHPPLTALFTTRNLPALEAALRELYERVRQRIAEGRTLAEILAENTLPATLRDAPGAVVPFLVVRENFVKRVHHQRTGYWKPDGEGIEVFPPKAWANALNLLAGRDERAFVRSARQLLDQGDYGLASKLLDLGLLNYPASRALLDLRRETLNRLRARHQQLNPFKFIVYSEWSGAELSPVD